MRGGRLTLRIVQFAIAALIVALVLSGRPMLIARAVSCVPADGYETNNDTNEACTLSPDTDLTGLTISEDYRADLTITFGFPPTSTFDCTYISEDNDFFKYALGAGDTFTVTVTATDASSSHNASNFYLNGSQFTHSPTINQHSTQENYLEVEVLDSSNIAIASSTSTSSATKTLSFTAPTAGDYKLHVSAQSMDSWCDTDDTNGYGGNHYTWTYNITTDNQVAGFPVTAEDTYEQNDTTITPYILSSVPFSTTTTTIAPAGDDDYFRFFGNPGSFTINAASSYGMNLLVELIDPSATVIASASGINPILTGNLTQSGYYLVHIDSVNQGHKAPYNLSIANTATSISEDGYEQNDTIGTARLITPPLANASATMYPANDPDYYLFNASAGTISASVASGNGDQYSITLYDPSNTALTTIGPSQNPSISSYAVTTSGNYKLQVSPATTTQIGSYTFSISATSTSTSSADPYEENDSAATSFLITTPASLTNTTIFPASDPDYFRFFANAGTATINIFPADSSMRFTLNLINPDGTTVGTVTNTANPAISASISQTGYYRIEIFETTARTGPYTLTATYSGPATATPGAITGDPYEENDTIGTPKLIGASDSFSDATIFPATDPDYYQFFAVANPYSVNIFSQSSGMSFTLTLYDPDGALLGTSTGANPGLSANFVRQGYYTLALVPNGSFTGRYTLTQSNSATAVRTPTPTGSPAPTVTPTGTPDMGGDPDIAEENDTWNMAFRIAPGNEIGGLNFNGGYGNDDIDFFVMNVKTGVTYTCETYNLGLGTDTIMSVYGPAADTSNLLGTHDDVNSKTGDVRSKITWKSTYQGQAYIVVDQVGPLTYPGAATYDFACDTGTSAGGGSSTTVGGGGSAGSTGGTGSTGTTGSQAISVSIIGAPERITPPEPAPAGTLMVNVLIAYDSNANGLIDLAEGVLGMSVRAIDVSTNKQLASGFTDNHGNLQLLITAPQGNQVMIVVPFLSSGKTFNVNENSSEDWRILLPSSLLPGFIP